MSFKNEKTFIRITTTNAWKDRLYNVIRQYVQIENVSITIVDDVSDFRVEIKMKNANRLRHDVEVMRICGMPTMNCSQFLH